MTFISLDNKLINLRYVRKLYLDDNIIKIIYSDSRWDDIVYDDVETASDAFAYIKGLLASNFREC